MSIKSNKLGLIILNLIKQFELVFLNGFLVLITLAQTVIITKFLTQEEYGIYGFYLTLAHFIYVFGNWGFLSWGTQSIASDLPNRGKTYSSLILSRILTCFFAYIFLIAYIFFFLNAQNTFAVLGFFIYSIGLMLSPEILFIVDNRIRTMVLINLYVKTAYIVLLSFALIFFDLSPHMIFLFFSILNFITGLVLLSTLSFRFEFKKIIKKININPIKLSFQNFIVNILAFIFASAPLILAGSYIDKKYFSVLYASFTIIKMLQTVYNPMIQRIIPRLNKLSVPKNEVFRAIKNDILSAVLFACTCCVIIWLTSPLIVSIIFSSDYEGLEEAIIFFSLALIPGLLSTIFISQVVIYIDIIKKAYISLGVACLLVFSILFYNIENLSVRIVLESLILGEWFLLLLIIYVIHKEIYYKNYD